MQKKVGGRERGKVYSFDLIKSDENGALHKAKKLQTFRGIGSSKKER